MNRMDASHQDRQNRRGEHEHKNDLNVWNGAALLVADCLGTGVSITIIRVLSSRVYYSLLGSKCYDALCILTRTITSAVCVCVCTANERPSVL